MKTNSLHSLIATLILLEILVSGCISNPISISTPQDAIIGKWIEEDGSTTEFLKEGTIILSEKEIPMAGNYRFIDDTRIRIEIGGLGALAGPMIFEIVSVSNNELVIKDPKGKVTKLTRISDNKNSLVTPTPPNKEHPIVTTNSKDTGKLTLQSLNFYTSIGNALVEAKKQDKSMFLYARSDTCGWCKKFEEETFTQQSVINILNNKFILVSLDVYNQKDETINFKVRGTPTMIFLNSNGNEIERIPGYTDTETFLKTINEIQ
jgi:thioredoxin-related protein